MATGTTVDIFAGNAAPFGRRQRRVRGARIPVTIVTGFLGSGKTTLIKELLATPEGANTAVVVNEYGEVAIDHALLRGSSEAMVLLGNGCVCCTVRSDLDETLRMLFADRVRGAVPSFERVIVETSGLADPGPVLQTFTSERTLAREFHLQSLVTVIDAAAGIANLERAPEARHQAALADRIVLTKTDIADGGAADRLTERIRHFSAAPIRSAINGAIEPAFVLDESAAVSLAAAHEHDHVHAHSHGIETFALFFDRPLAWAAFEQAMAVLTVLRGPDLLRVKGFVAVEGCRGPVVVHAVQHIAHRPVELEDWPDEDRRSRLVFITRNLARQPVEALFAAVSGVVPAAVQH